MNELLTLFIVLIAVFLFGMAVMRIGLEALSRKHMKNVLLTMTDKHWKSFLVGIALTAIVQSSSVVMAIMIGLVAAGMIRFRQSVGVILGANVGTTLTVEIITLDVSHAVVPFLIIGGGMLFFRSRRVFSCGCILFGLGSIFTAINGLENLAEPLADLPAVNQLLLITNQSQLAGTGLGALFTAIIQSSSAATGVVMAFIAKGYLSLTAAFAIVLGANIGTCFTAILAAVGTSREAKLTSYLHIGFNVAGVVLFFPFIHSLASFAVQLADHPEQQIAHISVLFNVICALAALPLAGKIADFCERFLRTPLR